MWVHTRIFLGSTKRRSFHYYMNMSCLGLVKRHDRCLHSTGFLFWCYILVDAISICFHTNSRNAATNITNLKMQDISSTTTMHRLVQICNIRLYRKHFKNLVFVFAHDMITRMSNGIFYSICFQLNMHVLKESYMIYCGPKCLYSVTISYCIYSVWLFYST